MARRKQVCYYRSGPIERDPGLAFHAKNRLDGVFTGEFKFKIIGDTFEHLSASNCPQAVYGTMMKKLRDQGKFMTYCQNELLLEMSLRKVRQSDFMVVRPAAEASGGTTSETVVSWLNDIPKLVIIGSHYEGLLDNNSTFMIRMLNQGLFFNAEHDVINFVREHIRIFRQGRNAIRELIINIKKEFPCINDRSKPLWNDKFEDMITLIYGRPGAGKDTQSRMLQHLCGFKVFSGGLELRRLGIKFPILGKSLGQGNLSPEIIMNYLMTSSLIKLEKFEPIVFSGNPKKIREAKELMKILGILKRQPIVIVIDISEELSQERIVNRRNCDSCEESFCSIEFVENPVCPQCGGPLSFRPENASDEAIKKIMAWYKTNVEKVIDYFGDMGLVTHIDGNRCKEEIFDDIVGILKTQEAR